MGGNSTAIQEQRLRQTDEDSAGGQRSPCTPCTLLIPCNK